MHLTNDDVFASEEAKQQAVVCQAELERLLDTAERIFEEKDSSLSENILMPAITSRAFPIIKTTLGTLHPNAYTHARNLGLDAIWCTYWYATRAAEENEGGAINLFDVLKQLNQSMADRIVTAPRPHLTLVTNEAP